MAYFRLIEAALSGSSFTVFGDGSQSRSNTYVEDVVDALIRATATTAIGATMNIAGGEAITLNHAIETIEGLTEESVAGPLRRAGSSPPPGVGRWNDRALRGCGAARPRR